MDTDDLFQHLVDVLVERNRDVRFSYGLVRRIMHGTARLPWDYPPYLHVLATELAADSDESRVPIR